MVRYLHVLQGGLLSLCVQQGEISMVLLRCHLNCFCHLPYQKLSAENKKKMYFTHSRAAVLHCFGDTENKRAVWELAWCNAHYLQPGF